MGSFWGFIPVEARSFQAKPTSPRPPPWGPRPRTCMLLVGVALPLSSPTYTVSHTGIRHGASLRVGECPDEAGFNTPPPRRYRHRGAPATESPAGNPCNLGPNPTQHEGGEESRRLGNRCHEKATLPAMQPASLGRKGAKGEQSGKAGGGAT